MDLVIGEKDEDPVVGISDLLIHLAKDQMEKRLAEGVNGEDLDIIIGGKPAKGAEKDAVKATVLGILKEKYGMFQGMACCAGLSVIMPLRAVDYNEMQKMFAVNYFSHVFIYLRFHYIF